MWRCCSVRVDIGMGHPLVYRPQAPKWTALGLVDMACEGHALRGERMYIMPTPFPEEFRRDMVAVGRKREAPLTQIVKDFGI